VAHQAEHPDQDQVDRDDVVQQARHDQDLDAGDDGDHGRQGDDFHRASLDNVLDREGRAGAWSCQ
jgi:hypothetical protein